MLNQLPDVGRIQGASLRGQNPKNSTILLQYTDNEENWQEVRMPFLDGMYLLNLLKALQIEMGFDMPEDPYPPVQK